MGQSQAPQYISIGSLRDRITNRLIPLAFFAFFINAVLSLARIPTMGFHPFMILHVIFALILTYVYIFRNRMSTQISASIVIGILCLLLVSGVATLGLLSATFIVGPLISLYLMLMGYRKYAYASIAAILAYLSVMAALFVTGSIASAAVATFYVRSPLAWILMITAMAGVSIAFVAPFEVLPGVLYGSEERFRQAFENANIGICITSLEGKLLKVNSALCTMLGYDNDELERLTIADVTFPDDILSSLTTFKDLLNSGTPAVNFEKRYVRKNGEVLWASMSSSLIRDIDTRPQYFITHIQNVTERKRAEDENNLLKHSIDVHYDGAYWHDREGTMLYVNDVGAHTLGYQKEELIGKPLSVVNPLATPERLQLVWEKLRSNGFFTLETVHRRRNGSEFPVEIITTYVQYQGRELACGFARDITERKRVDRQLQSNEKRFRAIVENSSDAITLLSAEGKVLYESSNVPRITGYDIRDRIGKLGFETVHPEDLPKVTDVFKRLVAEPGTKVTDMQFRGLHPDGTVWWAEATATNLLEDPNVQAIVVNYRDITARKEAQLALALSEERFRRFSELSFEGIAITEQGKVIDANARLLEMVGCTAEQMIGREVSRFIAPESRETVERRIRTGSEEPYEHTMLRGDGSAFPVEARSRVIQINGRRARVTALLDITERKRSADIIKASETKLRAILDNSSEAIGVHINGVWEACNAATVRLFRASSEADLIGKSILDVIASAERQRVSNYVESRIHEMDAPMSYVTRGLRSDGTEFDMEVSLSTYVLENKRHVLVILRDITERQRAEQERTRSISLLRATIESTADGILVVDAAGAITDFNQNFARMWQIPESILGSRDDKQAIDFVLDQLVDPDQFVRQVQELYAQPDRESFDVLYFKDGRCFERYSRPQVMDGRSVGRVWSFRDVTERNRTEGALRQAEAKFRAIVENSNDGVLFCDANANITYRSPSYARINDYADEDLHGQSGFETVHPEDLHAVREYWSTILQHPETSHKAEYRIQRKDRSWRWVESTGQNFLNNPNIQSVVVTSRDITERKIAEEQLRKLSLAVEQSPASIVITDTRGTIEYVNPKFTRVTGYTLDEVRGKNPRILKSGETSANEYKRMWGTITQGNEWRGEFQNVKKNGELFWEMASISPVKDKDNVITHFVAVKEDITERKHAEVALGESEEKLRLIFENANDGICIFEEPTDPRNRRLIDCNTRYAEMAGRSKEELLAIGTMSSLSKSMSENNSDAIEGSNAFRGSYSWIRPDGKDNIIEYNAVPIKLQDKKLTIGIDRDITQQKHAQEALQRSEERFRQLAEVFPESIFEADLSGTLTYANANGHRWFGTTDADIADGINIMTLAVPEERQMLQQRIHERLEGKIGGFVEYKAMKKNGQTFDAMAYSAPIRANGQITGIRGFILDISERKRAEKELLEAKTHLSRAEEVLKAGNWELSLDTGVMHASDGAKAIYGITEPVSEYETIQSITLPDYRATLDKALHDLINEGKPYDVEFKIARARVGRVVDIHSKAEFDRDRRIVFGVIHDITDRKLAEDERKNLELQLFQSQRIESIGTLASGIAHDFNNILNAIVGNTDLINHRPDDTDKIKQRTASILKSTQRGSQLVKQLMTLARKSKLEAKTIDINELIVEVSRLLGETLPKTIEMTLNLHQQLPSAVADPNQLHQVLLNLCFNARDAMPNGGRITIASSFISGNDLQKRFPAASSSQYISIAVRDTGIGIDESIRTKIFDPFFTTKGVGKGTGLGLSVALGIIDRHRGFIDVSSTVGGGSEFCIYVPASKAVEVSTEEVGLNLDALAGGNETLLFVEDEEEIRKTQVSILERKGYKVHTASDGNEAIEVFVHNKHAISMILSDLGLPRLDGEEVYRRTKEIRPDIPFILVTGFIEPEKEQALIERGVRRVIHKPYRPSDILVAIRKELDIGRPA